MRPTNPQAMRKAPVMLIAVIASRRVRPVSIAWVEACAASSAPVRAALTRPSTSVRTSTEMSRFLPRFCSWASMIRSLPTSRSKPLSSPVPSSKSRCDRRFHLTVKRRLLERRHAPLDTALGGLEALSQRLDERSIGHRECALQQLYCSDSIRVQSFQVPVVRQLAVREVVPPVCRRVAEAGIAGHRVEELVVDGGDHDFVQPDAQLRQLRSQGLAARGQLEQLDHAVLYGMDVENQRVDVGADPLEAGSVVTSLGVSDAPRIFPEGPSLDSKEGQLTFEGGIGLFDAGRDQGQVLRCRGGGQPRRCCDEGCAVLCDPECGHDLDALFVDLALGNPHAVKREPPN